MPFGAQRFRFARDFPREFTNPIAIRIGYSQRAVEITKMGTQPITLLVHLRELFTKSGAVLFCEAISPPVLRLFHRFDLFADAVAVASHRLHRAVAGSVAFQVASAILNALSTFNAGTYLWMARLCLWPALSAAWLTWCASAAATTALTGH